MADHERMEDEFLTCSICYDVFKEPKTLPCLHRFCEKCLHNYILGQKSVELSRKGGFQCPVCREFIKCSDPKRPPSDWASLIKTDFHLKNLIKFVEARADRSAGLQVVPRAEHPCESHKDQNRDLYCADCSTPICHLCAGISHRSCGQVMTLAEAADDRRALAAIELKDVSIKLKEALNLESSREKCINQIERQKNTVEAEIKTWSQHVQKLAQQEELRLLEQLHNEYDILMEKISSRVISFDEKVFKMKDELEKLSARIKSASDFDLLTNDSLLGAVDAYRNQDLNLKWYRGFLVNLYDGKIVFKKADISDFHLGNIIFANSDSEIRRAHSQSFLGAACSTIGTQDKGLSPDANSLRPKEAASAAPIAGTLQNNPAVSDSQRKPAPPPLPRKVSFIRSAAASGAPNLQGPNRRQVNQQLQQQTAEPSPNVQVGKIQEENESDDDHSVVALRTITTRFREDDLAPKLRDIIVISPANTVIVTDWANQSVKAFHVRRERDNRLEVGGKPWAITQLSDNLVAVSIPLAKQICVIKINPTLMVQNSFMSAKKYSGLASLNSSMLVASGGSDPPSVDIINLYGEILKSFSNDNNGTALFVYPSYVSVTPANFILVSDRDLGAVICLSHNGEIKFTFHPEAPRRLHQPCGLISDKSGRIFVAESRGLLALTSNGQFDRAIVRPQDELLDDPRGVALDSEGLVYITHQGQDIKVLRVT